MLARGRVISKKPGSRDNTWMASHICTAAAPVGAVEGPTSVIVVANGLTADADGELRRIGGEAGAHGVASAP